MEQVHHEFLSDESFDVGGRVKCTKRWARSRKFGKYERRERGRIQKVVVRHTLTFGKTPECRIPLSIKPHEQPAECESGGGTRIVLRTGAGHR